MRFKINTITKVTIYWGLPAKKTPRRTETSTDKPLLSDFKILLLVWKAPNGLHSMYQTCSQFENTADLSGHKDSVDIFSEHF